MNVTLKNIRGIDDAMISLYMSKGNYDNDKDFLIRETVKASTNSRGFIEKPTRYFNDLYEKVLKYGVMHTTILRFIDFSFVVEGLHRGAQDDLDAHAERFHTRIIRQSTRLGKFKEGDVSDYYNGKILTTYQALTEVLGMKLPDSFMDSEGNIYLRTTNGYIREDCKNEQDVIRGLYNLSIPSTCICKIDLLQYAHVYRMRNKDTHAHEELRDMITSLTSQLAKALNMSEERFITTLNSIIQ